MPKYSDFNFVPPRIQRTPLGERYIDACVIMRTRALEIDCMFRDMRLGRLSRAIAEPRVHFCRREYMAYSNLAHAALDELTKTYNWPPQSAVDESFTWPPAPVPRQVDPTAATSPKPSDRPSGHVPPGAFMLRDQVLPLLKQGARITGVTVPPRS